MFYLIVEKRTIFVKMDFFLDEKGAFEESYEPSLDMIRWGAGKNDT